jgi:mannosyltransferase OCH1-like enzyme
MLPRVLHQIWYNFGAWGEEQSVPSRYDAQRQSWITHNPEWSIMTWNESLSRDFLKHYYPDWFSKFMAYEQPIQRADFFRWAVLYHYGGVYADMDCRCQKPIESILPPVIGDSLLMLPDRGSGALNALIIATPKHLAVEHVLSTMPATDASWFGNKSVIGIFGTTGPSFVKTSVTGLPNVVFRDGMLIHQPSTKQSSAHFFVVHDGDGSWNYKPYLVLDILKILTLILLTIFALVTTLHTSRTHLFYRAIYLFRNK